MLLSSLNKNTEHLHFCVIDPLSQFICFGVGRALFRNKLLHSGWNYRPVVIDCVSKVASFLNLEFCVASCPSKFSQIALFVYLEVVKPCCKFVERCLEDILFRIFSIRNSWLLNIQEQLLYCTRGSVY